MLKTNKERLVKLSVQGKVRHPLNRGYRVDANGIAQMLPSIGGITYNVHAGDPAFGWEGDHVEPGVSIYHDSPPENMALLTNASIGNTAIITTGDAKGATGIVIGKHGGIDDVIIQFKTEDMEKMTLSDVILVKSFGLGLKLPDYPDVHVMNIDPEILEQIEIEEKDGKLIFPVAAIIPAGLMGSGIGSPNANSGDYDILTQDLAQVKEHNIDKLRLGDFVLITDADTRYGRTNVRGAVTVGIVVHSDCILSGHGPGVTTLLTSNKPIIEGKIGGKNNIVDYIKIG